MGSNKFNRALGHLKSTSIDEKIRLLDEQPTNNTTQIYIDEPDTIKTITLNPNLNPLDLTQDADGLGRDTTGLFMPDGTILTEEPPGDTSYILGPMAAMYYTWSYPWTMIGYIRQSDRKMVNLGRIDGKLSDWDGSVGDASSGSGTFRSYGQVTTEQALWFRDIQKQPGATNDPSTYNYYAFYPGPPSQFPDAFGRYPCAITGVSKNRSSTTGNPATDNAKGINPEWGLSGYMFVKVGDKWVKKYYYNDGTVSSERSGEMTPDNPFYDAYMRGGGDEAAENGYSREEIIRNGNEQIQSEMDQQARQDYQDTLKDMFDKPLTIDDFKRAADYSAYKNGGGDAARMQGKSVEDIIRQGMENINQYNQDPRISQRMADALDVKNSNSLGDKIMRFFGDLGDLAQGKVINSTDYNAQLAINLAKSILTGSPQEIKLGSGAKRDQINSVDPNALGDALQIGTAPTPNASNAVNPTPGMKSDQVLRGGWGVQGGSEFSYDPVTDTFTITSNKMLRTGQAGDQFDITRGGRVSNGQVVDRGKQTAFGDIPDVDPEVAEQGAKKILNNPLVQGYLNLLSQAPGVDQTYGNPYQMLKNDPDAYEQFEKDVAKAGADFARSGVQGSASNAVAIRKALTDLGFPKSEIENVGAGYGQVFSATEYKGSEIPKEIRDVINKKTRNESFGGYTRKRILREIKNEVVLPDEKKEKLKGYRPKPFGKLHAQYDKLMQKAENPASFKQMDETAWTKQDKYYNTRLSQERKNEVLDHIGTSDHYWDILTETGRKRSEKGLKEKYGDFTLVRKEQMVGDTLLFLVDEHGKKETVLQSEYSDRIARQMEEPLWEQETLNAPNDPLIKRVKNKLATQIDYPDKPSRMGYPDGPTPQQVAGWHPEYGKRSAYYNALDPQSADSMPATGDPETDQKVAAQKTPLIKKTKKELKAEARLIQSDWKNEIQIPEKKLEEEVPKFRKLLDVTKERGVVSEKMTSSSLFNASLSSTGENINATVDMGSGDSFFPADTSIPASKFGINVDHSTSHDQPSNVFPGFSDGNDVLYFATPMSELDGLASSPDYFMMTTNPVKLENDTVSFRAIAGNSSGGSGQGMGSNGGTQPYDDLSVYWFLYDDDGALQDFGLLGTVPKTTHANTQFDFTFPPHLAGKQVAVNFFTDANQGGNESDSFLQGFSIPWHPLGSLDERGFGDNSSFLAWVILNHNSFGGQGYASDSKQTLASSLWNDLQGNYTSTSGWNQFNSFDNPGAPAPVSGSRYAFGTQDPNTFADVGATTADLDYITNWIETNMSHLRGQTTTTYAVSSLNFRRRAPMNVFVTLDDPDASSFIRMSGLENLSAEERKKRLAEMLDAGDEYMRKYLGMDPTTARPDGVQAQHLPTDARDYTDQDDPILDGDFPDDPFDDSDFPDLDLASADWPKGRPGKGGPPVYAPWNKGWPTAPGGRDYEGPPGTPGGKYPMANKDGKKKKQETQVAHHELEGDVISEKKRLKNPEELLNKIPGYYDGKPAPLGFPVEPPAKMINGFHADLVTPKGQEKQSNRYNRMDQATAKATPMTGNPYIDKKVLKARNQPK